MNLKESADTYRPVFDRVMEKYPKLPEWRFVAETKRLMQISSDARDLIGKRVLDLGCGSKETADRGGWLTRLLNKWFNEAELAQFEPWYCRIAHAAGAQVTGIDIASNISEEFSWKQLDLMNPEVLRCLPSESFDGANNMRLTVPDDSVSARSGTSPAIMHRLGMDFDAAYAINAQIFREVERVLKDGGIYTISEFVFRKKKGRLKKYRTMEGLGS